MPLSLPFCEALEPKAPDKTNPSFQLLEILFHIQLHL